MRSLKTHFRLEMMVIFIIFIVLSGIPTGAAINSATAKRDVNSATSYVVKVENTVKSGNFNTNAAQSQLNVSIILVEKIKTYGKSYDTTYNELNARLNAVKLKIETKVVADKAKAAEVEVDKVASDNAEAGKAAADKGLVKEVPILNQTSASLSTGKTMELLVSGTILETTWSSSDPYIAKVDNRGKVTGGHKAGVAVITAKTSDVSLTCNVTNSAVIRDITAKELVSKIKIGSNFASALDYINLNSKNGYNDYDNTSSIIGIGFAIREPGKDYNYSDWGTSMQKGDSIHQSIPLTSLAGCDPSLKLSRAVIQAVYRGTSDGKMTMMVSNAKIMVGSTEYKLDYLNGTHNMTMYSQKNSVTGIFNCGNSVGDEKESGLPQLSKLVGGEFEADIKIIDINESSRDDKTSYYLTCDGMTPLPSKEMVKALKDAGYDSVRLTVSWTPHMNDRTFLIDKSWLDKVEELVNWFMDNDMYCIINAHYDYLGLSWVGDHWDNAWMLPKYKEYVDGRFTAMWSQIAERFKDYDDFLIFEDMNEPYMPFEAFIASGGKPEVYDKTQADRVNELNGIFYSAIQKSGGNNRNRFLMLACAMEKAGYLKYLELPNSNRIIATVHTYYDPSSGGLYYNGTDEAASYNTLVDKDMERISSFIEKTGTPVIIGEFANTQAIANNERIVQATYLVQKAKEIGVPCMWWECAIYAWTPDNTKFGLYNREKVKWEHPDILQSIMSAAKSQ